MAKVQHTVTGCVPIDRSVVEAYSALITTNKAATVAEDDRQEAEGQGDYSDTAQYPDTRRAKEAERQAAETERIENEGSGGPGSAGYSTSRIKKEIDRQAAETQRQTNEGIGATDAECAAGSRRKNESIRQSNEATRQAQEGTPSDAASASGSRWARYKYAEASRQTSYGTAEGEASDEASASGSRWARYKYAESVRETAYDTAEAARDAAMAPLVGYYACSTAASTAAKEVAATNYVLTNGGSFKVEFAHANTAVSDVTLNINSQGAKELYYNGSAVSATNTWKDGDVLEVYYDYANERYQAASSATKEDVSQLGQKLYETEQVDGTQIGTLSNGYLDEDGNPQTNANYRRRVIPNDGYIRLTGHGSSVRDMYVVAFYNSTTISSSTLISGIKANTDYADQDFDIRVPEGTMAIVVVYTTYSYSTPAEITLFKGRLVTGILQEEIDTLSIGVDYALSNNISKYSKDGYLKADGSWDNDNTIKSIDNIPVKNGDILLLTGFTDVAGMLLSRLMLEGGTTFTIYPNSSLVENLGGGDYRVTMPTEYNIQYATISWLASLSNIGVYKVQSTDESSKWNGKIWVGLGDSLTAQSSSYVGLSWSPKVEAQTGLEFKNCGIGSTCLAGNGTNAFWKRLAAVEAYDPDLVTILGGANDLAYNIPIGTNAEFTKAISAKDTDTFKGAYSYIIETLLTWKASLRIVIMTTAFGDNNDGYKEYADACKDVAAYYGLPCVDLYGNMGLNKLTSSIYTSDNLHWNAAGSQIVASLLISKLNEINNA